jgi:transcriptional regulator with XRE-family HTH domain
MQKINTVRRASRQVRLNEIFMGLSIENQEKLLLLRSHYRLLFRSQEEAALKLKVSQGTMSRYLSGETGISYFAAKALSEASNGAVTVEQLIRN